MTDKMLVIVPSRGRPENVARLEQGLKDTFTSVADVLYVVDDDDPEVEQYRALDLKRLIVGPRLRLGGTLNAICHEYTHLYPVIGFMGDDHLPRTPEWDLKIMAEMASPRPRVVYGDDLFQGHALPTAAFLHSKIVDALGYMVPPGMVHLYLDNFWMALGQQLGGLVYRDDVIIEHLHPAAGKSEWDAGYSEVNAPSLDVGDRNRWMAYQLADFPEAINRVKEAYSL